MEWVVTTGKSVDEATEAALDELGVEVEDLELEILEEPKPGLFGRVRGEARVRARIRPTAPRPKVERRRRSSKGRKADAAPSGADGDAVTAAAATPEGPATAAAADASPAASVDPTDAGPPARSRRRRSAPPRDADGPPPSPSEGATADAPVPDRGAPTAEPDTPSRAPRPADAANKGDTAMTAVSVDEQAEVMRDFLDGLLDAFDLDASISVVEIDDETDEVRLAGDDLGLLIGPKGQTLAALQDLARTVAQRRLPGPHDGWVRVDVSGYRQRRREALERFARQVAEDVASSGSAKVLEPMSPADRKIVHDVINEIDGVTTSSEGEEPRRRVVVQPA